MFRVLFMAVVRETTQSNTNRIMTAVHTGQLIVNTILIGLGVRAPWEYLSLNFASQVVRRGKKK